MHATVSARGCHKPWVSARLCGRLCGSALPCPAHPGEHPCAPGSGASVHGCVPESEALSLRAEVARLPLSPRALRGTLNFTTDFVLKEKRKNKSLTSKQMHKKVGVLGPDWTRVNEQQDGWRGQAALQEFTSARDTQLLHPRWSVSAAGVSPHLPAPAPAELVSTCLLPKS